MTLLTVRDLKVGDEFSIRYKVMYKYEAGIETEGLQYFYSEREIEKILPRALKVGDIVRGRVLGQYKYKIICIDQKRAFIKLLDKIVGAETHFSIKIDQLILDDTKDS